MRKCAANVVPECFSMQAENQCKDCGQWYCSTHIVTHTNVLGHRCDDKDKVTVEDTNITLLQKDVVFDDTIPQGIIKVHPYTFCQMAAHCIRDRINGVINTKA